MESVGLGSAFLVLVAGCVLTVITIIRMHSGKITLPQWGKVLVTIGMIASLLILAMGMLPPLEIEVDNPFISESISIVTPADASVSPGAAP